MGVLPGVQKRFAPIGTEAACAVRRFGGAFLILASVSASVEAQFVDVWRDPPVAYSADFRIELDGMEPVEGLIAHVPGKTRQSFFQEGGRQTVIFDFERQSATVVVENQRMAVEIPLANYDTHSPLAADNMIATVQEETETMIRYRLSWRDEDRWRTGSSLVTADGIVTRIDAESVAGGRSYSMRLMNLVRGPQDRSQFMIAPGTTLISNDE